MPTVPAQRGREMPTTGPMSRWPTVAFTVVATLALCAPVVAQQPAPGGAAARPAPTKQAAPQKAAPDAAPTAGGGETASLRQRVEQLEEQLVDMQVMVGTLESLARGGGASGGQRTPASLPSGSGDIARMEALEGQVRALMAQVETLQQQVRQGNQRTASALPPAALQPPPPAVNPPPAPVPGLPPALPGQTIPERDPIGTIIGSGQSLPQAAASDAAAKQLYETAYGLLLQQDYASAEAAFEEFLKRFPNDTLAGNAQYWLGETFYVRGNFKASASAFLKGYQTYGRSSKAPDSLLKLAMSLDRLGQRDSACASYSELNVRFPNAPGAVRSRADTERRRLGCA